MKAYANDCGVLIVRCRSKTAVTGSLFSQAAALAITLHAVTCLAAEPRYRFDLSSGTHVDVCEHMHSVFNLRFTDMWHQPPPAPDPFIADGAYSFPLLPGASHDSKMTGQMMFSKQPSSAEFDAVEWQEAHAPTGIPFGPSEGPYLIAHFDIDNDGKADTVIKPIFTKGYSWLASRDDAEVDESLVVYHDRRITPPTDMTSSQLSVPSATLGTPAGVIGNYLRPFVYSGRSYLVSYDPGFDATPTPQTKQNLDQGRPPKERLYISTLTYKDPRGRSERPALLESTICIYDMIQIGKGH